MGGSIVISAGENPAPLKELDVTCEMEKLGIGRCAGYKAQRDKHSFDEALRLVKYPWTFSGLQSVHSTYGYIAFLDRSLNEYITNRSFESIVGKGRTPEEALYAAVEQIEGVEKEIADLPKLSNDY
jgi:hypothetical protein